MPTEGHDPDKENTDSSVNQVALDLPAAANGGAPDLPAAANGGAPDQPAAANQVAPDQPAAANQAVPDQPAAANADALDLLAAALEAHAKDDAQAASVLEEFIKVEAQGETLVDAALAAIQDAGATEDGVTPVDDQGQAQTRDSLTDAAEATLTGSINAATIPPFNLPPAHKYHIWPLFITAVAVFLLLTGGLTYFNRTVQASQADTLASIKQQGDSYLDEAISFIQEADSVVVALDQATDSQIKEEDIPKLEALLDQYDSTQSSLDKAIDKANQAKDTYVDQDNKALAQHAIDAAELRKQMLNMSSQLTRYDIDALKSAITVDYAWNQIVDADTKMRNAADLVATNGASAVSDSRDYNQTALDQLNQAQGSLAKMPDLLPGVDVSCLNDYLNAKITSAQLALASDDAYLAGDLDTANAKNEEFNQNEQEVVDLAAKIPSDPMTLVVSVYNTTTQQLRSDYKDTRSQAADADAYLRAYLGVDVQ